MYQRIAFIIVVFSGAAILAYCAADDIFLSFAQKHCRTKKLAIAPNGYDCGFPKPDGSLCSAHFLTKKLLQDHKKKEGHIRKVVFKKPTGRKKKKN